jgi:hypothetical protein
MSCRKGRIVLHGKVVIELESFTTGLVFGVFGYDGHIEICLLSFGKTLKDRPPSLHIFGIGL